MTQETTSARALRETLTALGPLIERVVRIDASEGRVAVDLCPLRETSDGKIVDTGGKPDRITAHLPGAAFPKGPPR